MKENERNNEHRFESNQKKEKFSRTTHKQTAGVALFISTCHHYMYQLLAVGRSPAPESAFAVTRSDLRNMSSRFAHVVSVSYRFCSSSKTTK
jgi:hypothetical protein